MNEFKFYGEENTENDDAVQLREQQAEKEAEKERKYKKHSVLDNTALFLFIVLIAENTILFATRIFFQEEMYAKAMPFFMELFILVLGAGIFSAYRYIYHSLTITNMKAIIITEAVLIVGEFIVYSFCVPVFDCFKRRFHYICGKVFELQYIYTACYVPCAYCSAFGVQYHLFKKF